MLLYYLDIYWPQRILYSIGCAWRNVVSTVSCQKTAMTYFHSGTKDRFDSRIWHELSTRNIDKMNAWMVFYQNPPVLISFNLQFKWILVITCICNDNAVRTFFTRDQGVAKKTFIFHIAPTFTNLIWSELTMNISISRKLYFWKVPFTTYF